MKKTRKLLVTVWIVMLVMIINLFPYGLVYAANIDPSILTNLSASVTQGGVTIPENGTITSNAPIRVDISFGVPVVGDELPSNIPVVKWNDTVTFQLSNAFTVPNTTGDGIRLEMGSGDSAILVGHAKFVTDDNNMVTATVNFNGAREVFEDLTIKNVRCQFGADFEYNDVFDGNGNEINEVTILSKSYNLNVPIEYVVTKTGNLDWTNKLIEWSVIISASQGTKNIDLAGYKFKDDLENVGDYVTSSFKVGENSVADSLVKTGNVLTYEFPDNSISPKTITFKTKIPDALYYATSQQTVTNTAKLIKSIDSIDIEKGADQAQVTFTPTWIQKSGLASNAVTDGAYNPKNRTITWTIIANHDGASLNNVVITDLLPEFLTYKSASWQTLIGSTLGAENSIEPEKRNIDGYGENGNGEYKIGTINSKIILTIVTDVPNENYTVKEKEYTNSANIKWEGSPDNGLNSNTAGVKVGYDAITKTGTANPSNQTVRWTVNVDTKQQSIPDLKVYDLLVYGNSITLSTVTGLPSDIAIADLTPRYGQKYAGNFAGTFTVDVIPIMQGTTRVADLLEITGLSTTDANTFSFDSQVLNPDIFAGNKTSTVTNTATLFSANANLNEATADVNYTNNMLRKRLLNRTAMSNPAAGVNSSTTSAAGGFDYQDKSAIFRLSVNADGINVTNATNQAGQKLGTATLTDTLPVGWEFVDIIPGSNYLVFEGTGQTNGNVQAINTTPDTVIGLTTVFSGRTATFTFTTLAQPYVILVKARPTTDTAAQYFSENQTLTVRNNVTLKTENWNTGVSSYQDVTITSNILDKTATLINAGELRWTVDYRPYELAHIGYKLEDQLPIGIDLRLDSTGKLILTDNISVNEMTLNADGSYTLGNPVALVLGTNVSYNNTTRVLSFIIPDNTKAYRFSYVTDVTGVPGSVKNKVSLFGSTIKQEEDFYLYNISTQDGSATLQRNGWINIIKENSEGTPLAGAEFTLFAMDGTTVIKRGTTAADGTLKLKVIPDGSYILRETLAPSGFALEGVDHSLVVTTSGSTVTSSLDGKTGQGANSIIARDFSAGIVGNLRISKAVAGEGSDTTKQFEFTVTLPDGTYNYIGDGIPNGTINSGGTISLAHGQSINIVGLPKNTAYAVTEADYENFGYTTTSTGAAGNIVVDATQTASFVNTYNATDTLAITAHKTISGRLLIKGEFGFSWQQIDPLSSIPIGETLIAKNTSTGDVFFPAIYYTAADDGKDFIYQIQEVNNKVRTIKYDQTTYKVMVHVTDLGDGSLKLDKTIYKVDVEGKLIEVDSILFQNNYDKSLEGFPNDEGADTGDNREMHLLGFMAFIGLLGMGTSAVVRRKRTE